MGEMILQANQLAKRYRLGPGIELPVLTGASLTLTQGEFVAVMGSSGERSGS